MGSTEGLGVPTWRSRSAYGLFFLSGVSGLLFEHVWFRKAGLVFGNGVWASSLVLASFMAGLATGSALAARLARRFPRPIRAYAAAEAFIALLGVGLVLVLPKLSVWLAPVQRHFLDDPLVLNGVRLGTAFLLIGGVTTAMGTTLPLLTRGLTAWDPRFGSVLGRLYGWNTLGATVGALAGESLFYGWLGVRGTGLLAGGLSLAVAAAATTLGGHAERAEPETGKRAALKVDSWRLLATAFLAGALLLALEIVWWRFLLLFSAGSSRTFAVLLAVVLAGIGAGGLVAAVLLRRRPSIHNALPVMALTAGALVLVSYSTFGQFLLATGHPYSSDWSRVAVLAAFLTLPVSLVSGVLFTFAGAAFAVSVPEPGRASGLTSLANTVGAMSGSLVAGFLLLPSLGMELSFAVLGAGYGLVALLAPGIRRNWRQPSTLGASAVFIAFAVLFPRGLMENSYLRIALARAAGPEVRISAFREGLTETVVYLERTLESELLEHRLMTNGFTMSSTSVYGRRYMKHFVYLPGALHPHLRRALLISYGVGSTAKALTDTGELESIDIVDISREILELSTVVFPDAAQNPLRDPRVTVHVEDGRFFLQTTSKRFDLITAEPPPPKVAGVVNLYSLEYFQLLRDRLAEGGIVTYWLPLHSLEADDARAIIGAFCGAFDDCTLWKSLQLHWMLVGTRHGRGPGSAAAFARQWRDPHLEDELRALGFETPEQLGALFVADAPTLRREVGRVLPLMDDFPHRLAPMRSRPSPRWYTALGDVTAARERFRASDWVSRVWPKSLRESTLARFEEQRYYDQLGSRTATNTLEDLHKVLTTSSLRTLPLLMMGTDTDAQRVALSRESAGDDTAFVYAQQCYRALAARRFLDAAEAARMSLQRDPNDPQMWIYRAYALTAVGRTEEAREVIASAPGRLPGDVLTFVEKRSRPPSSAR